MSPRLQRLRAEISSDARAFESRLDELMRIDLSTPSEATLAQTAVALHHAYGAVESALSRAARTIDGGLPEGADWHQALLESMTLDIESVRPAVLSAESVALLRPLLAFRHFFRHAYAASWDAERLMKLRDDALRARTPLRTDLARLDAILRDAARSDGA